MRLELDTLYTENEEKDKIIRELQEKSDKQYKIIGQQQVRIEKHEKQIKKLFALFGDL